MTTDVPPPDATAGGPDSVGAPGVGPWAGARSTHDAEVLARWERITRPIVIVAALLPFVSAVGASARDQPYVLIDLGAWLVFLVDFLVHLRRKRHYLGSRWGQADLAIVVLTFPYYLIPGIEAPEILGALRLARLARILMVGKNLPFIERLFHRLNKAVLYSFVILFVCSWIVYKSDGPADGYDTMWDAMWWGIVTLTTVGYGDLTPTSSTGRWAAVVLMIAGLALLGPLAGSLSQIFGLQPSQEQEDEMQALRAEVLELRRDLRELGRLLGVADEMTTQRGALPDGVPPPGSTSVPLPGSSSGSPPGSPPDPDGGPGSPRPQR